jgi:hypothetical protein
VDALAGYSFTEPQRRRRQALARARQHFFLGHRYRDAFDTDQDPAETIVTFDAYDLCCRRRKMCWETNAGAIALQADGSETIVPRIDTGYSRPS